MDKLLLVADRPPERFEIVDDGGGGVLVFRYVSGANTHDYYQLDVPMAQRCAADLWGVQASLWRMPRPEELPRG